LAFSTFIRLMTWPISMELGLFTHFFHRGLWWLVALKKVFLFCVPTKILWRPPRLYQHLPQPRRATATQQLQNLQELLHTIRQDHCQRRPGQLALRLYIPLDLRRQVQVFFRLGRRHQGLVFILLDRRCHLPQNLLVSVHLDRHHHDRHRVQVYIPPNHQHQIPA